MIRLCFIIPSLKRCGPNTVAADIVNSILDINPKIVVDLFYFDDAVHYKVTFNSAVRVKRISFFEFIDFSSYDVVHSHMLKPDLYLAINSILGRTRKCTLVTTLHQKDYFNLRYDYDSRLKAFLLSALWRVTLFKFDKIVCLSKSMINYYGNTIPKNRALSIYNGRDFDVSKEAAFPFRKKYNKILGASCFLTKRKGLEQVIYSMPYLQEVVFFIAGDGPERAALEGLVIELNLEERVFFLGHIEDITCFLNSIDVYVLPSRAEGFPLSLIEALSQQKACVVSDIDVVSEVFKDDSIVVYELDNINNLVDKILYAFNNKSKIAAAAYERYTRDFTSQVMAEKYLKIYSCS